MNIGCLFGSFDPPHAGHLAIARHMLKAAKLDQVWLVVTPQNPFKQDRVLSPEHQRLAMARLAVQGEAGIVASGFELDLPKPNYTADTLAFMRERWPHHDFSLIIGSDNLAGLHTWKEPHTILDNHRVLVYPRPGIEGHMAVSDLLYHPSVTLVNDAPLMDISSTGVRVRLRNWKPVEGLIHTDVGLYIRQNSLYTGKTD